MKKENIFTVLFVVVIIVLIAGITYAWITWTSDAANYQGSSDCFNVLYEKGNDIGSDQNNAVLFASDTYEGGLSSTFKINFSNACTNVDAKGKIYLNTLENTSSVLYEEDVLNYQVLRNGEVTDLKGIIISSGDTIIDLGVLSKSDSANDNYTIYVWIDNNKLQNKHAFASYYGKINVEVSQIGV